MGLQDQGVRGNGRQDYGIMRSQDHGFVVTCSCELMDRIIVSFHNDCQISESHIMGSLDRWISELLGNSVMALQDHQDCGVNRWQDHRFTRLVDCKVAS